MHFSHTRIYFVFQANCKTQQCREAAEEAGKVNKSSEKLCVVSEAFVVYQDIFTMVVILDSRNRVDVFLCFFFFVFRETVQVKH